MSESVQATGFLEDISYSLQKIADVICKEDVQKHRDVTNLRLYGLAQGFASELESIINDDAMTPMDRAVALRLFHTKMQNHANEFLKEQEKIDNAGQ